MDTTLAQADSGQPDWGQIGGWIAAAVAAGAAVWSGFRNNWKPPGLPPPPKVPSESGAPNIAHDGDLAVQTLQALITTLQGENERLWDRIKDLETRDGLRESQNATRELAMQDLRRQVSRLRTRLVQAGIDPGDGD